MNRSRNLAHQFGRKLTAAGVLLVIVTVLIAPQVDLDDTTLQTGGLMPMVLTKVVIVDVVSAPAQRPAAASRSADSALPLTDLHCARLI